MTRITDPTTVERTVAVVCDRCQTRIEAGGLAFDAVTRIDHTAGYGGAWEDGTRITADICEVCLRELIGDFCRVHVSGKFRPSADRLRDIVAEGNNLLAGASDEQLGQFTEQIPGAARGLLADVKPQPECDDEASRNDALERLRDSVSDYQEPSEPATPASDWNALTDSDDFIAARSGPVLDPEAVFQSTEEMRASGELAEQVTFSDARYQASTTHPGMLERIDADGSVTVGAFRDGKFHPLSSE